jgi:hypothetical protein
VDYLDEDAQKPMAPTGAPHPSSARNETGPELGVESGVEFAADDFSAAAGADPFLRGLLPEDRNARRRVVTALLRAVLAERKIT